MIFSVNKVTPSTEESGKSGLRGDRKGWELVFQRLSLETNLKAAAALTALLKMDSMTRCSQVLSSGEEKGDGGASTAGDQKDR